MKSPWSSYVIDNSSYAVLFTPADFIQLLLSKSIRSPEGRTSYVDVTVKKFVLTIYYVTINYSLQGLISQNHLHITQ
jgi:hypothetical protein